MRRGLKLRWDPARKRQVPVVSEEDVVSEIMTRLRWANIKVYRVNCPVGGKVPPNVEGIPDLMGWIPQSIEAYSRTGMVKWALPLYIEVKRPGGARRPAQIRFIEDAEQDGCVAFFAESWDDVVMNLRQRQIEIKN